MKIKPFLPKDEEKEISQWFSLVSRLGGAMTFSIIIFFLLGLYIDRKINTKGIFTILFLLLGIGIGAYYVYKIVMNLENHINKNESKKL